MLRARWRCNFEQYFGAREVDLQSIFQSHRLCQWIGWHSMCFCFHVLSWNRKRWTKAQLLWFAAISVWILFLYVPCWFRISTLIARKLWKSTTVIYHSPKRRITQKQLKINYDGRTHWKYVCFIDICHWKCFFTRSHPKTKLQNEHICAECSIKLKVCAAGILVTRHIMPYSIQVIRWILQF